MSTRDTPARKSAAQAIGRSSKTNIRMLSASQYNAGVIPKVIAFTLLVAGLSFSQARFPNRRSAQAVVSNPERIRHQLRSAARAVSCRGTGGGGRECSMPA